MHRVSAAATAATIATAVLVGFSQLAAAQVTAYEGGRLIVGNGSVVENATLVADGTKIVQAGQGVAVPAGATRVNLAGKTVMPAIVDSHVHLSPSRESITLDLKRRAYFGVGAVMSMGADLYPMLEIRNETIPGAARFLSAGRGITMPEPGRMTAPHWIGTEEEAVKVVQELATRKVDLVKIWVDDWRGKFKKLTPEIYGAIIKEAHKNGLRVAAHLFELEDAKGLIKADLDAFAHGVRDRDIDDEFVAMFKARPNLVLIPNLPERGVKVDMSWMKPGLSAEEYEKLEKANVDTPPAQVFHAIQARNLKRLNEAGVRILMGTDGNRPWGPHEEMEDMVLAGMTPMQVIVAATRNGAEFLKLNDMGTLQVGKSADFIVLEANPLDDIKNTRKISSVVLRGAAVDRSQPVR